MNILKDRRGYSMTFWAVFIAFILVPIMALSIEAGALFLRKGGGSKGGGCCCPSGRGGDQPAGV